MAYRFLLFGIISVTAGSLLGAFLVGGQRSSAASVFLLLFGGIAGAAAIIGSDGQWKKKLPIMLMIFWLALSMINLWLMNQSDTKIDFNLAFIIIGAGTYAFSSFIIWGAFSLLEPMLPRHEPE